MELTQSVSQSVSIMSRSTLWRTATPFK